MDRKQVLYPPDENNYRLSEDYESGRVGLVEDVDDYILIYSLSQKGGLYV